MPKAKPYPDGEEEERTTIESQWEEEASTTVEQGDVAEKIKSLGAERRPNTNTGAMDELTVDDQHAPVLSAITPLRADQNARLSITQGNDTGQAFEIRPGKSYTIGRAIDNDVVLTDIAVSRKHFDLRHEDGAWVIVDHGSGNGTVVNGNVEDNPFMLANGDVIEIGNTVFRFEQEKGPVRAQPPMGLAEDDEEMSTVAGKPLRAELIEVEPAPTPVVGRHPRPKTLPPPMPMRSIGASQPPPLGLPPQPASTLPLPQMANRPPPAGMPTMLGDSHGLPLPGLPPQGNGMPTTLPGQPVPPRPAYQYPQATEIPPHSVHAQMLLVQSQNRRGDASTAHVPPMSYDPMLAPVPMAQPQLHYSQPQLSSRTKHILGGIGLAVLAAIATIAIVKSGGKRTTAASKGTGSGSAIAKAKTGPSVETIKPVATKKGPTVEAIDTKTLAKAEAPKQEPWKPDPQPEPKQDPQKVATELKKQEQAKQELAKQELAKQEQAKQEQAKQEQAKQELAKQELAKQEQAKLAKQELAKQEQAKQEQAKQEQAKQEQAKQEQAKQEQAKQEQAKQEQAKQEQAKQEQAKQEQAKQEQAKQEQAKQEQAKQEQAKQEQAKQEQAKQEQQKLVPKKPEPKVEPKKMEARTEPKKREQKASTSTAPAPKKVAVADTSAARSKAEDLYHRKKFNDAASVLTSAARSAEEEEAKELDTKAEYYVKLGKALNSGTAPATDPIVAFDNLRKASNYDKNVGDFFGTEIKNKLEQVAPKAAYSYLAKKNYQAARIAVLEAERYGNADGVSIVRQKLESVARDLYQSAQSDGFDTNNSKDKLKQIKLIVDSKSPWYQKAQKALGG